jgi:fibronectin type 3 domain-containing protein
MKKFIALLLSFIMVFTMVFNIIPSIIGPAALAADDPPLIHPDLPDGYDTEPMDTKVFTNVASDQDQFMHTVTYELYVNRTNRSIIICEYIDNFFQGPWEEKRQPDPIIDFEAANKPEDRIKWGTYFKCDNHKLYGSTICGMMDPTSRLADTDVYNIDVNTGEKYVPGRSSATPECYIGQIPEEIRTIATSPPVNWTQLKLPKADVWRTAEFLGWERVTDTPQFDPTSVADIVVGAFSLYLIFSNPEFAIAEITLGQVFGLVKSGVGIIEGVVKLLDPPEPGETKEIVKYKYTYEIKIDDCVDYEIEMTVYYIHRLWCSDGGTEEFERDSISFDKLPLYPKMPGNIIDEPWDVLIINDPCENPLLFYQYYYPPETDMWSNIVDTLRYAYCHENYHNERDEDPVDGFCDFCGVLYPLQTPELNAVSDGYNRVKLTWEPVPGADGYEVCRSEFAGGTYTCINPTEATTETEYTDTGLTTGKKYYYKVSAYMNYADKNYYSEESNAASAIPALVAPEIQNVTPAGSDYVKLSWSPVPGATGYDITRSTSESGTYIHVGSSSSTSFTSTGLNTGDTYYYKIRAYRLMTDGHYEYSNYSSYDSATPILAKPEIDRVVLTGYDSILLSWDPLSGATGYEIWYADGDSPIDSTASTSYTDTGLTFGDTYSYKIRAYRTVGDDDVYSVFSDVVSTSPALRKPTLISVTSAGYESISLDWSDVAGADGYVIYLSDSETGSYLPETNITDPGTTDYTYNGLTTGKTYYYKVRAYRMLNGRREYSDYSNFDYAAPTLDTPLLGFETPVNPNSIRLTWSSVPGAAGYSVYHYDIAHGTYSLAGSTSLTRYGFSGLDTGVIYSYKVRAYRVVNGTYVYSGYSNYISAAPAPSEPAITNETPEGAGYIRITWDPVEDATGYEMWRAAAPDGTYEKLNTLGAGSTACYDTSFTGGKTYYYKVRASITVGENDFYSPFSNIQAVKTPIFSYDRNPDGTLTITGYFGSALRVTVPSVINGKTVMVIGNDAFSYSKITSIVIPKTVIRIGARAFSNTTGLKTIKIPNSVSRIGEDAFQGSGIKSITLSKNLTEISAGMFSSSKLKSIDLPKNITSIGDHSFSNCHKLTKVSLSKNITDIGPSAFIGCDALKKITIPKTIAYIGMHAFSGCTKLKEIKISNKNSAPLCVVDMFAFAGCSRLTSVKINSIESLGDFAFSDCGKLKKGELKNVRNIGSFAFSGCSSLKEVSISNTDVINDFAFSDCSSLKDVDISGTGVIGMQAFGGCANIKTASVGANEIGTMAFMGCQKLKNLKLKGTETIGLGAFMDCASLKNVKIPNGTVTIDNMAFLNCSKLEDVSLPDSLTSIGINAFAACMKLKNIVIPGSVTNLGTFAFAQCESLKKAVIPGSVSVVSAGAFAGCSSLKTVVLGEGIHSILEHAFAGCTSLANINCPVSLIFIDETAFEDAGISLILF